MSSPRQRPSAPSGAPGDVFRRPFPGAGRPLVRAVDLALRGTGQVVFQSNWLTGALILVAVFANSVPYGLAALVGVATSTVTAVALRADRGLVDAGLFGFNGVLAGIGVNAYLSPDLTAGTLLGPAGWGLVVLAAAGSTVLVAALGAFLAPLRVAPLTAPFVLATWVVLFAVPRLGGVEAGPLLQPSLPEAAAAGSGYTWATWYEGTLKGIGEIFFQDNGLSGALILLAVAVNSRVSALMALLGSLLGVAVASLLGAAEGDVALGLYGFNAALTGIALGGFFLVLSVRAFAYALLGMVLTVLAWPALATLLAPAGMPTLTMPFVLVTWLFLLAAPNLRVLAPVPPAEATYAERHLAIARGGGDDGIEPA